MRSQKHLLIVVLLLSTSALADEPVQFGSAELKSLVQKQLGVRDPTPTDMPAPEELQGSPGSVASLAGLEYAHNLKVLSLSAGRITDLGPLQNLAQLQTLELPSQWIVDLSPLTVPSRTASGAQIEADRLCSPAALRAPQFQRDVKPRMADTTRLTAAAISIRIASAVAKR